MNKLDSGEKNFDKSQASSPMKNATRKLFVCTAPQGYKFIGFPSDIVNPCADAWEPNSIIPACEDESGHKHTGAKAGREIVPFTCYIFNSESGTYKEVLPCEVDKEVLVDNRFYTSQSTVNLIVNGANCDDSDTETLIGRIIRKKLLMNTICTAPIYIDEKTLLHTEGDVTVFVPLEDNLPTFASIGGKLEFKTTAE